MANEKTNRERKVPILSVWKNDTILKNIFLVNTPPSLDQQLVQNPTKTHQDFEETLLVGRHPDCDIRLEHPSISRFHLRIHSKPESLNLSVTDLSSVHGTWISGQRIEPNVRTGLNEGDTLKIGGSSRVYNLHWIPLSQAYDMDHPFVPPFDSRHPQEDDEEEIIKGEESLGLKNDGEPVTESVLKGLESLVLCDDYELVVEKEVLEAPPSQQESFMSLEKEATELVNQDFDGLGSLSPDVNSDMCVQEEIFPVQNEIIKVENKENSLALRNEVTKLVDPDSDGLDSSFPDVNSDAFARKEIPPAPPVRNEISGVENEGSIRAVTDEDTELENPDSDCSQSSFPDENSDVSVQQEIQPAPPLDTEKSEVENEDRQEMDSALEGLVPLFLGENWEWIGQENHFEGSASKEHDHEDEGFIASVLEGLDNLFLDENSELLVRKVIPIPSMPEDLTSHLSPRLDKSVIQEYEKQGSQQGKDVQDSAWNFWYRPSSPATKGVSVDTERNHLEIENQYPLHESEFEVLSERKCSESVNVQISGEEHSKRELWSFWSGKMGVESVCSYLSDAEAFSESDCKSLKNGYLSSPQPLSSARRHFGSLLMTPEHDSARSIWSRRGKQESAPQVLTSGTKGNKPKSDQENGKPEPISRALFHEMDDDQAEEEIFTPDKENFTPNTHKSMRRLAVLNELKLSGSGKSSVLKMANKYSGDGMSTTSDKENYSPKVLREMDDDQAEQEIFTPDKENFTPNTHKSMRKLAVLNELKLSGSGKSSILKMANKYSEDGMSTTSDKENYSPKVLREQKIARHGSPNQVQAVQLKQRNEERQPFQSLLVESPQRDISENCIHDATMRSTKPASKTHLQDKCSGERIRKWNMIVDTTTLLNNESRKALQLLEGLKGTQLVIPKIVIKELDSLKRQVSFFRRNSEASAALEWIQDCMVKTQWWIHVQSSIEEGRAVAPTPPASPLSPYSYATLNFSGFSCQPELLSPTAEDHVLDYVLYFRRTQNDGQLVLLSNDITLKIKAMAEGLICEETEEFRESLVNPFSERFLWEDSSPRGQTWSCSDDIVLRERFYPSSLKMTPKAMENVKGLKLILLHNSQYFERSTAIR